MGDRIRVIVAGACGKMGREVVKAVLGDESLELVGGVDLLGQGTDLGELVGYPPIGRMVSSNLEFLLKQEQPEVMVDFTEPQSGLHNIYLAIENHCCPVIGTTGIAAEELKMVNQKAYERGVGAFLAPNFALGAVLMMKFAQEAARYFHNVEIIELHHDQKLDAPSGTALRTADLILKYRPVFRQGAVNEQEKIKGARGAEVDGLRIHSVRLPGYVAHQEVIFGDYGQTLTLRHDSINRECFMPGVLIAIHKVVKLRGLVIGLEQLLDT